MLSSIIDLFNYFFSSCLKFTDILLFFFSGLALTTISSLIFYMVKGKF